MRFVFIFLFSFLSQSLISRAQQQAKPAWAYGVNPYYGGVFRYKEGMPQLKFTNLYGIELHADKLTNGSHRWEKMYNYPRIGFAASYYNYGMPNELGKVYALTSYLDVTSNNLKKNQWRINIGTGFVYSTKTFDGETNPDNKAVSSKISYVLRGTVYREFQLSDHYFLNINLAFRHFSNGKLNIPNNGMNLPMIGVGLRCLPKRGEINYLPDTISTFDRKLHLNLMASTARREVLKEDFKHKAYTVSIYAEKQVTKYNKVLAGLDGFFYDHESVLRALSVYNFKHGIEDDSPDDDGRQLAITVGAELLFGKLSVLYQAGIYLYKPQVYYESKWYQRYGFKYQVLKNAFINTTLKTHSRTADMVEFGIGFSI